MNIEINHVELLGLLPHRSPFLMVDRLIQVDLTKLSCTGLKLISAHEPYLIGHFPGDPVMPGVLMVEAMAQAACGLIGKWMQSKGIGSVPEVRFASIDNCKFKSVVRPGQLLEIKVEVVKKVMSIWACKGQIMSGGIEICEAEFKAAALEPEYTLSLIKPHAVAEDNEDAIIRILRLNGLKIAQGMTESGIVTSYQKKVRLSFEEASKFYAVHAERPFFKDLCTFMSSGEIIAMVLEGQDAVAKYRKLMGATNPAQAEPGTLRHLFGKSLDENAVHGSDSKENAVIETNFFFPDFRSGLSK